ncbi:hypothetical protein JHN59_37545 [Streptomyces sp. MBT49]|uniref:hypothetical protein n=1 Tax=Streptomyces sp. MBT49 TaxID=1488380 RepID=UPI0019092E44|nr:hypothetical protein [Streptomyces sp. MBT49]MBK3630407.1 hypothetical protein [Streptomyces sp. MBT49]
MHRPVVHRRDPRLEILTEAVVRLIPGAAPAFVTVTVTETLPGTGEQRHTWTGRPEALAQKQFTALWGRPRPAEERSPLAAAADAKRARDLAGEIGTLAAAGTALESAPWYPARRGDVVIVHYPAAGDFPAFGETYVVDDAEGGGGLLALKFVAHSAALADDEQEGYVGAFAVEAVDCPLYEAWFEAGPHLLTIVRDGRPVHVGGAG